MPAMTGEKMGGVGAILAEEIGRAEDAGAAGMTIILVEGASDQRAIEALARRQHRDLGSEDVAVIPMAGATNITRFMDILGPNGYNVRLAGLYDEGEEKDIVEAVEQAGIGSGLDRVGLERLGFFVCVADLEEELIRALGPESMLDLMESQGHMRRFRSFQNQPAQRHKTIEAQLWRWLGNFKIHYAPLMVEALDLKKVPRPMEGVLAKI